MKPGTRALAISLVGLALVALVAWRIVGRQPGARGPDLPSIAELPRAPLELADSYDPSRSLTPIQVGADSPADSAGTGTLLVRVVDDPTNDPLAGVALTVGRERGGSKLLATGTTNERGEARFDDVEANTVIVQALRKPPYASAFGAVWLEPREREELVLRLGSGVTVRARVVDDVGTPIENVDVLLEEDCSPRFGAQSWIHGSKAVSARTASDGRFELAHLARAPVNVWIEKGSMKPERWSTPEVWLRFEDAAVPVQFELGDAAEQDLGDLVISRAATWSGHVLDARGQPVGGALITPIDGRLQTRRGGSRSGWPELAGWPGVAGFKLWPGETLSAADGSFELRGRNDDPHLTVITTAGSSHECRVPAFEPGARFDGLELHIGNATMLVLELVDKDGRPILEPHPRARTAYRPGRRLVSWRLEVDLICADAPVSTSVGPDPDGLFRVQVDETAGAIRSLFARLGGYEAVEHTFTGDESQPLRFVLEEMPVMRLRVHIAGDPRSTHDASPYLDIQACLRDPAEWTALPSAEHGSPGCCGLGARLSIPYRPGLSDVELAVAVDRPFFVRVRNQMHTAGDWSSTFGPWTPGAEWRAIEVPPPPPATAPVQPETRAEKTPARLRARLVDARSGETLKGYVRFNEPAPESLPDGHGRMCLLQVSRTPSAWSDVEPGSWLATAVATGHAHSTPVAVELVAGVEHDLGTFALEPWQKVDVLVLDAAGRPAPDGLQAHFGDASGWSANGTVDGGEGRFVLQAVVPAAGAVTLLERLPEMSGRAQTLPFAYDGSGSLTLRLAPWRRVEVRIETRDVPEREAWIDARILRDTEFGPWQEPLREGAFDQGARLFSGWAVPGRWTLRCQSLLVRFPETQLDISADGDEVVRVEVRPDR